MKKIKYLLPVCFGALFCVSKVEGFVNHLITTVGNVAGVVAGNHMQTKYGLASSTQVTNTKTHATHAEQAYEAHKNDSQLNIRQHYAQHFLSQAQAFLLAAEAYLNTVRNTAPHEVVNAQNFVNEATMMVSRANQAMQHANSHVATPAAGHTPAAAPAAAQAPAAQTTGKPAAAAGAPPTGGGGRGRA